ncbi:hypothetical protein BSKO_11792 [Bryopsis sp. KO-2023]|nr:hypothetical protein BSKO_01853 [Bryopsis sp. KO-2023]GMH43857.1 hypothetical protein BSKO_11791 [Bryopsis sp. KO-2023]GMH43858.1 hypothetical protein BSKO_11792 [Bryopsis sp. KO-2023]
MQDGRGEAEATGSQDEKGNGAWTLRKCSAAGLDLLSEVFGDGLLTVLQPIVWQQLRMRQMVCCFNGLLTCVLDKNKQVQKAGYSALAMVEDFDQFGIIRDIIQNHLLQEWRNLSACIPMTFVTKNSECSDPYPRSYQRKRFSVNTFLQWMSLYLDDETVPKGSKTPTFASCVMYVKNDRWDGVPFILKDGKALNERKAEVRIQLKPSPAPLYAAEGMRNGFVMRLQPGEAIYMKMVVRQVSRRKYRGRDSMFQGGRHNGKKAKDAASCAEEPAMLKSKRARKEKRECGGYGRGFRWRSGQSGNSEKRPKLSLVGGRFRPDTLLLTPGGRLPCALPPDLGTFLPWSNFWLAMKTCMGRNIRNADRPPETNFFGGVPGEFNPGMSSVINGLVGDD